MTGPAAELTYLDRTAMVVYHELRFAGAIVGFDTVRRAVSALDDREFMLVQAEPVHVNGEVLYRLVTEP